MSAERVEAAARMLPDTAPLIPMETQSRGGVRAGWRGKCQSSLPCQFALTLRGKACLRRIQIAERTEAERGQAGAGRMITRREVK